MQYVETSTEPSAPVYNDHLDALLDEYDYGCEPMTTLKRKHTRNAIYCPFKLQYSADSNRPEFVKLSYVPGFYISPSRFDADVLYLFKPKKENFRRTNAAGLLTLEPFAQMSGFDLERGSRLFDFSRAFKKWKWNAPSRTTDLNSIDRPLVWTFVKKIEFENNAV